MLRHLCGLTMHAFVSSCVLLKLKCEFLSVGPKHTGPAVTQKELDPKGKTPFHGETEQEKVNNTSESHTRAKQTRAILSTTGWYPWRHAGPIGWQHTAKGRIVGKTTNRFLNPVIVR